MLVNRNSSELLPNIRKVNEVNLVPELINEIPSIIEQLDKLSEVPIKSSTANDISPKSDSTADNLKQQLLNWQIIHAIMNSSSEKLDSISKYVKNNLTQQLACLIYFKLSYFNIDKYFSELESEKYSSDIGNYIVEKMVPREQKYFEDFRIGINILESLFGVPLIKDCNQKFLIRYFESWNKPNFESNPKGSIYEDLNSVYPKYGFFLFFAQVIYRIHQKDKKYDFKISRSKYNLKEIRKKLMNVNFFCGTETDRNEIVDCFLTFFDDSTNFITSEEIVSVR